MERRRSVQEWFEQQYVLGAIDPLIAILHRWMHMIVHRESQPSLRVDFSLLPHLEISRLNTILRSSSFDQLFYLLSSVVYLIGASVEDEDRSQIDWPHITSEIAFLQDVITDLQSELLKLRIRSKAEVTNLYLRKEIVDIRYRIEQRVRSFKPNEIFRLNAESSQLLSEIKFFYQRAQESCSTLASAIGFRDEFNGWAEQTRKSGVLHASMLSKVDEVCNSLDHLVNGFQDRRA